jgi:hypothetical protein
MTTARHLILRTGAIGLATSTHYGVAARPSG